MAKAAVILAEGFEEIEAVTVIDILRRADLDVRIAGLQEGLCEGGHGIFIETDCTVEDISVDDCDMIILPGGGAGARRIAEDRTVDSLLREFAKETKYVAAICAAPFVLAEKGILNGCMATSYPSFKEEVETDCEYHEAVVVVDENIITSRGPATAAEFAFTLVELLLEEDTAENLREAMLFDNE